MQNFNNESVVLHELSCLDENKNPIFFHLLGQDFWAGRVCESADTVGYASVYLRAFFWEGGI